MNLLSAFKPISDNQNTLYLTKYSYKDCVDELLNFKDAQLSEILRSFMKFQIPINYLRLAQELFNSKRFYNLSYLAHCGIHPYISESYHIKTPYETIISGNNIQRMNNGEMLRLQISYECGGNIDIDSIWDFFFLNPRFLNYTTSDYAISLFISYASSAIFPKNKLLELNPIDLELHPVVITFMIYYGLDIFQIVNDLNKKSYILRIDVINFFNVYMINCNHEEREKALIFLNKANNVVKNEFMTENYLSGFFIPIYTKTGIYYISENDYKNTKLFREIENISNNEEMLIDMTHTNFTSKDINTYFMIVNKKMCLDDTNSSIFNELKSFFDYSL